MKKLFTLLAFLTCFLGANAKEVVDVDIDFSTQETLWGWSHGWVDDKYKDSYFDLDQGCLHFHSDAATDNNYDIQLQPFPGADDTDAVYTVTIKLKGVPTGDQNQIWLAFGGSETPGWCDVPADFEEFTFTDVVNNPNAAYFANSCSILLQCGHFVGDFWIASVKITHDQKEEAPVTWIDIIENGDASAEWANPDAYVADNAYQGEGAETICAYSKEYGYNDNNPHAAFIEDGAFYTTTAPCEDMDGAAEEWQNQFWINFPRALKDGEHLKLSFDYKASEAAQGAGQGHRAPGDYLGGWGPGTIDFTTEWQTFSKEFDASADCHSIAFNLGVNGQFAKEITFYFDNIKLEYMDLEDGWFVTSTDTEDGDPAYDFDNAISFEDAGDGLIAAVVGGESEDEWVDQVMISTQKGNDKGYKAATIKVDVSQGPITNDPDDWHGFEAKGKTETKLPVRGQWKIYIDEESSLISFEKLAGEEDKELEDIAVNESELKIEGVERKYKSADEAAEYGAELPEDYEYTGQPWDNQFWIVATRGFDREEQTTVEFDYYLISDEIEEAKVTTQSHGPNCNYIFYSAIGDITFTKEEQHFSKAFDFPQKDWQGTVQNGIQSIAFNMAEIPQACTYVIKNIKWYVNSGLADKTTENLIPAEGTDNFWVKIGAGTAPYQWGKKPADVEGDVNGDNEVGVGDLISVSNYMADGDASGVTKEKADVNKDDEVGVGDLITISNIMAGKEEE